MTLHKIKMAIYSLVLTNYYGLKLKKAQSNLEKKRLRIDYSKTLLGKLNISVKIENEDKIPQDGQYLLVSNHRGIIDPLIVEMALEKSSIYGLWISKKELYNSFFFGLFVRNGGSVLVDRDKSQMGDFFAEIKKGVKSGASIFIFPEGTRNKTESELIEFKDGARLIALKNRLPILPVYISTHTNKALKNALEDSKLKQEITIKIGDLIDYKDRTNLKELYQKEFSI